MRIAFLILSDYGESVNGKLYTMGAGWNALQFAELPQEWRFSVGMGIDVPWDETNQRHHTELRPDQHQGKQGADPGGRQRGENRQRMDVTLVQNAQHDIYRHQRRQNQDRCVHQ